MEIGPVSYPDSLFASCGRLPYPHADRSHHVWNLSPSLTDDARVMQITDITDKNHDLHAYRAPTRYARRLRKHLYDLYQL